MYIVKLIENTELGWRDPILNNQPLLPFFCPFKEMNANQDWSTAR